MAMCWYAAMVTIVSACNDVNICLKYLQGEIKKKVDAVIMSMERGSVEHEPVSESSENAVEDDLNNVEEVTELLEHAF